MTHTVLVGGACHERKTGIVLRDKYLMGSDGGTPFRRYSHPLSYQQHFPNRTLFLIQSTPAITDPVIPEIPL